MTRYREGAAARRGRLLALLEAAQASYDTPVGIPHPGTSDIAAAHLIGRWKAVTGRTRPRAIRPTRGDSMYIIDDMTVRVHWMTRTIERRS